VTENPYRESQPGYGQEPNAGQAGSPPHPSSPPPHSAPPPPPPPGYGSPQQGYAPAGPPGPPQGAGGYAPAPPPPPVSAGVGAKGFLGSLFDFSFTTFVTPKMIRVLYILITVVLGLGYVAFVVGAFLQGVGRGLLVLVAGAVVALFYLVFARVALEFYMAVFRMSDDMQALRRQRGI